MSLGSNPSKQNNIRSDSIVTQIGESSGWFVGLRFNKEKQIIPPGSTKIALSNPTVLISGTDIYFDFSHIATKNTSNKDINNLKILFKSTVSENETITITNGEYLNELSGDMRTYDVSGTIRFKFFDENNLTLKAEIIALNNQSPTYKTYDYRYFLNQLTWAPTSLITSEETKELNEIINMIPTSSLNSFTSTLGEPQPGDIIELLKDNVSYTFKVSYLYRDQENLEHIGVYGKVPNIDLFGSNTFVRRKSRKKIKKTKRKNQTENINSGKTYEQCLQEGNIKKSKCQKGCVQKETRTSCKKQCKCHWAKTQLNCWENHNSSGKAPKAMCSSLVNFCSFEDWIKSPCNK